MKAGLFVNVHFHHLTLFKGRVMRAKNKKSAKSIPARRSPLQQNIKNIFTGGIAENTTIYHHFSSSHYGNEGDKRQFETENELTTAINEFLKANKDYNIEVTDKSLFALLLKEAGARS